MIHFNVIIVFAIIMFWNLFFYHREKEMYVEKASLSDTRILKLVYFW